LEIARLTPAQQAKSDEIHANRTSATSGAAKNHQNKVASIRSLML
jgi:hypothetical protein